MTEILNRRQVGLFSYWIATTSGYTYLLLSIAVYPKSQLVAARAGLKERSQVK